MSKSNVSTFLKNTQTTLSKHSPKILTGVGIIGMVGTTVMAVKATPKAIELLEEAKREKHEDKLTPVDVVKTTWRCYLPALITGGTSIICLVKANSISTRRNAALATAYNLSRNALSEYKDKVIETFGEKKEQVVIDNIAKEKIKNDPVTSNEVIVTEKGTTICYDGMFGRYFTSDIDTVKRAINSINRAIVNNMYVSLNEFYSELGLPPVGIGEELGWNFDDGEIRAYFSSQLTEDGRPCLVITYNVAPRYDYSRII